MGLAHLIPRGSGSALGVSGDERTQTTRHKSFVNPDVAWGSRVQVGPGTGLSSPTGYIRNKTLDISGCGLCPGGTSRMSQRSLKKNRQVLADLTKGLSKGFTARTSQRGIPISFLDCFKTSPPPRGGVSPPALF